MCYCVCACMCSDVCNTVSVRAHNNVCLCHSRCPCPATKHQRHSGQSFEVPFFVPLSRATGDVVSLGVTPS